MDDRADITQAEVFISWTGKDEEKKEHIVNLLKSAGISCKESGRNCSGDYRKWSREAVGACEILLLVLTENTFTSEFIPMELDALEALVKEEQSGGLGDRIVPVCDSQALYRSYPRPLHQFASAVFRDSLTEAEFDAAIVQKVTDLLVNRMEKFYRRASAPDYMHLEPLYSAAGIADRSVSLRELYIPRTITGVDTQEGQAAVYDSPAPLLAESGIFFIHGPSGSGKSAYTNQIRQCAPADTLVFSLSCARIAAAKEPLFRLLYQKYAEVCGNRNYNSPATFRRLLSIRRAVLVLDGMDEIATGDDTRSFLRKVEEYYTPNALRTTLVFTSRYRRDADLIAMAGKTPNCFRLEALREEQIRHLGENLFRLLGAPEKAADFYAGTQRLSREIRSNPLLLSQLAIVYEDRGSLPDTQVGIWDAVADITFRRDRRKEQAAIPPQYEEMIRLSLPQILKDFSRERYQLLSAGRDKPPQKILAAVLKKTYPADSRPRAEFLMEYLHNRAVMVDGEFYHKGFLEYFTAMSYYEHSFDDYDEIDSTDTIEALFSHYSDAFWMPVIQLFLMKADNTVEEDISDSLYKLILDSCGICEYTLLFDTAAMLSRYGHRVQLQLVTDILQKSIDAIFPAYGPLFWYVPEYNLYEAAVLAARNLKTAEALALVRDVCVIFGQYSTVAQVTSRVGGMALYDAVKEDLSGVRDALCWIFCTGTADLSCGTDIYPRCFNTAEAAAFLETGCGIRGRIEKPFVDELGLYRHYDHPRVAGEFIGIVSCPYDKAAIEARLNGKPTRKLRGLCLTPTEDTVLDYISFQRSAIRVLFPPENITKMTKDCRLFMPLQEDFTLDVRFRDKLILSGMDTVPDYYVSGSAVLRSLELGEGITAIGKRAFCRCANLTQISLPDSLKVIGNRAFLWCGNLRTVRMPRGLAQIGPYAFTHCESLEEITVPGTVEKIEEKAFGECSSLSRLVLEEGIRAIEKEAFASCKQLRQVFLPDSVTELGVGAFFGCDALEQVRLPGKLQKLPAGLFTSCPALEEIEIPDSVNISDGRVFSYCCGLRRVKLSRRLTEIPNEMFAGCSIEAIEIPSLVTRIGRDAFRNCTALREIRFPQGLRCIGDSAFSGCTALKSLDLPNRVSDLGKECFKDCTALEQILLPSSLPCIADSLFENCTGLRSIRIPGQVTAIGHEAFRGCEKLEEVLLPPGLETIGFRAFGNCSSLKTMDFPARVQRIVDGAYENCTCMNDITLPVGLLHLGPLVFKGCTALTRLTVPHRFRDHRFGVHVIPTVLPDSTAGDDAILHIPKGTVRIGANAFKNTAGLKEVILPPGVKVLEDGAFSGCPDLRRIHLPSGLEIIGAECFLNCEKLEEVILPDGVTRIGDRAFAGCSRLKRVWLPDSVMSIGERVFLNCKALTDLRLPAFLQVLPREALSLCTSLKQVSLPDSIHTVGENCFTLCIALEEITLPKALTRIPDSMFLACHALRMVTLPSTLAAIGANAFSSCISLEQIMIPEGVTEIGPDAFIACTGLTQIHIPDSVKQLGSQAHHSEFSHGAVFRGCTALTHVRLPKNLTAIPDNTFEGCSNLKQLEIPAAVTGIGCKAFFGCTALRDIRLPQGLTIIGSSAFTNCAALESLILPDSVTEIRSGCFSGCTGLREITLSPGLTQIPSYAFDGCAALARLVLPEGTTTVYHDAFRDCEKLEEVTVPTSVRSIGQDAFRYCEALRSVTISANFKNEISRIFGSIAPSAIHFI